MLLIMIESCYNIYTNAIKHQIIQIGLFSNFAFISLLLLIHIIRESVLTHTLYTTHVHAFIHHLGFYTIVCCKEEDPSDVQGQTW